MVGKITTDKKGFAEIKLPYGSYTFKQVTSTPNYEKVKDFEVIIDENSEEDIYKLISNAPIEARIKIVKVDKETGETITRKGIKFRIQDILLLNVFSIPQGTEDAFLIAFDPDFAA